MNKDELVKILKENFMNKNNVIDISGLDLGNCSINISGIKCDGNIIQCSHVNGGDIVQCEHFNKGNIGQQYQANKGDVYQQYQANKGDVYQYGHYNKGVVVDSEDEEDLSF